MIHYSYFSWPFLAGSSCKIPFETWPWSYQNICLQNFYFINKMHAFFKNKAWIVLPTFLFKLNTSNININCVCKCKLSLFLWSLCSPLPLPSLSLFHTPTCLLLLLPQMLGYYRKLNEFQIFLLPPPSKRWIQKFWKRFTIKGVTKGHFEVPKCWAVYSIYIAIKH